MRDEVDIAIIGAGAAGIGAAMTLRDAPVTFVVLEARDRLGGRGLTAEAGGHRLDLGCGWLHSADVNPFSGLAERLGFEIDRTPPPWGRQSGGVEFGPERQAAFGQALETLEARVEAAAARGEDGPISALLDPDGPFNPLLNAFSSYYNGAEFDAISTLDYAAYDDTEVNWRASRGYGALIAAAGGGAPVMLEWPVTRIDHGGSRIRIEGPRGALSAGAVIVTVPTPLIADGVLAFSPDLPDHREAAAALPLGLANKVFLRAAEPEAFELEGHLFGDPSRTDTGSYHLRPFGRPILEVYFGGRHAHALEAEGPGAGAALAIEELAGLLGSGVRRRLTPIASSAWAQDPWSRGAYSHALPGHASARSLLSRPVEERLFFAGEAASANAFSTAHGAFLTGCAAARQALGKKDGGAGAAAGRFPESEGRMDAGQNQ